jgi:hypothetical protein
MGVCWILNALDIGRRAFFRGHHVMGIVESDIGQGLISDGVGYQTCCLVGIYPRILREISGMVRIGQFHQNLG